MKQSIDTLKTFFETGDKPTQQQMYDFLESYHHLDAGLIVKSTEILVNGDAKIIFNDDSEFIIPSFVLPTTMPIGFIDGLQDALNNAGSNITASNGLTETSGNIKLGGTINSHAIIDGTDFTHVIRLIRLLNLEFNAKEIIIKGNNKLRLIPPNIGTANVGDVFTLTNTNGEGEWKTPVVSQSNVALFDNTQLIATGSTGPRKVKDFIIPANTVPANCTLRLILHVRGAKIVNTDPMIPYLTCNSISLSANKIVNYKY